MNFIDRTIQPAIEFIKSIKTNETVLIVYGHDSDTVCSAAILFKLLKRLGISPKTLNLELNFTITKVDLERIEKIKPKRILIPDIAQIDQKIINSLRKFSQVLIIDHHVPVKYSGVTYCNPRNFKNTAYIPVTYLSYQIYKNILSKTDVDWIAGIGTLGDHAVKNCLDLFFELKGRRKELVGDVEFVDEKLFDGTEIGKLTKVIDSGRVVKGREGAKLAFEILVESRGYNDILNWRTKKAKILHKYFEFVSYEFNRLLEDFFKSNRRIGKLIVFEIKSRVKIKSSFAGYLPQFFDDEIILVYQKDGKFFDISLRRGKNVKTDLGILVGKVAKAIPNSTGGGHPAAAAARIPVRYFKKFVSGIGKAIK